MEIQNILLNCQNILYKGFTSTEASNLEWLNVVCGEFIKLFTHLHKFLIFECTKSANTIEDCFLCISQIMTCIRNLERVITTEERHTTVLTPSRQHFLDRVLWCLARLKALVQSVEDNVTTSIDNQTDVNFVRYMDIVLDLLYPFTIYPDKNDTNISYNVAERNAHAMLESTKIRSIVDLLISQALAFINVALPDDKQSLTVLCQKVLRECINFEEECSLSKNSGEEKDRRFKAELLETSLYQLESLINDCLLKLVCYVFADLSDQPIQKLRQLIDKTDKAENLLIDAEQQNFIDEIIEKFDLLLDRIMQIGILGIAFSEDNKIKSILRSCLASFESLDACLIPSIFSHCAIHSSLLENHWNEEIFQFRRFIQEIIDTNAFCDCIIDLLSSSLDKCEKKFDYHLMQCVIKQIHGFNEHITWNEENLKMNESKSLKSLYDDYKVMVKECAAALELADTIEPLRIIKRFRILLAIFKKIQKTLKKSTNKEDCNDDGIFTFDSTEMIKNEDNGSEKMDFIDSLGITAHVTSILYKNNTADNEKSISPSMIAHTSKLESIGSLCKSFSVINSLKKNTKKRCSLRVAIFKRQKLVEVSNEKVNSEADSTMNLNITDILEQLTSLSSTLSLNDSENTTNEIEVEDHKIRIQICFFLNLALTCYRCDTLRGENCDPNNPNNDIRTILCTSITFSSDTLEQKLEQARKQSCYQITAKNFSGDGNHRTYSCGMDDACRDISLMYFQSAFRDKIESIDKCEVCKTSLCNAPESMHKQ